MTRRPLSNRLLFTGLMSGLATIFGSYLSVSRIFGQADVLTDVLKIGLIIAVGTAGLSFIFWTLSHLKQGGPGRGALAGLMTALCVVPLPVFAWHYKTDLISAYTTHPSDVIAALFQAILPALGTGLLTFQVMTKAALIAVILSAALGYAVSRWGPDPRAGTLPPPP